MTYSRLWGTQACFPWCLVMRLALGCSGKIMVRHQMNASQVISAYERWAPVYDISFGRVIRNCHRGMVQEINQYHGKVLDVGVGTGVQLPHYGRHLEVTGIDLSPAMLERARRRVEKQQLSHVKDLIVGDAKNTDFPDASFDLISAAFVMSVVPDPKSVLIEMDRVLVPGGRIFILNHFRHEKGLLRFMERMMAPLSPLLGWHPDMQLETVIGNCRHQLVAQREFKPFGIFTMLHFHKES